MQQYLLQLLGFTVIAAVPWLCGYFLQRRGGRRSVLPHPPRWVALLLGNPRGDGTIDLGAGGMQLAGVITLVAGLLVFLLGLEFQLRAVIVLIVFYTAMTVWLVVVYWANWREHRRHKGK